MKKVTIEFEIEDHFDRLEMERVISADKVFSVLWDLSQELGNMIKRDEDEKRVEALEEIREYLNLISDNVGIDIHRMYP